MERSLGSSIRLKDYTVDRYMASKLHRILGYVWPERMMTTWIVWISTRNKDNGWIFSERCRSELQQVITCGIKSTEREICLWNFIRALGILDLHMDYEFMLMMTWIDWIRISDRSIELHRPIQPKSLNWRGEVFQHSPSRGGSLGPQMWNRSEQQLFYLIAPTRIRT